VGWPLDDGSVRTDAIPALAALNERRLAQMCQVLRDELGLDEHGIDLGGERVEVAFQLSGGGAERWQRRG
jgi:hypothetical protein